MDDYVAVVEEDPAGPRRPLTVKHGDVGVFEARLYFLAKGLGVAGGEGAHDHEVVGESADFCDIEQQDIGCLPFGCELRDFSCLFEDLQACLPPVWYTSF